MVGQFAPDDTADCGSFASDVVTDFGFVQLGRQHTEGFLVICKDANLALNAVTDSGSFASVIVTELDHLQVMKQGSLLHEDASLKLLREFRNEVERWQWRGVAFSNDDEHIIGASNAKNEHIMYVWNAVVGNLERILEGKHNELPNWTACLACNCSSSELPS